MTLELTEHSWDTTNTIVGYLTNGGFYFPPTHVPHSLAWIWITLGVVGYLAGTFVTICASGEMV